MAGKSGPRELKFGEVSRKHLRYGMEGLVGFLDAAVRSNRNASVGNLCDRAADQFGLWTPGSDGISAVPSWLSGVVSGIIARTVETMDNEAAAASVARANAARVPQST